ncbi:MAG: hypothetical protein V1644_02170 [Candidatus Micrarchaeota archaeon]
MVIVSAPGKILWIGGYAVLERPNVSFVTGVDKRVYCEATELPAEKIAISSPQFNLNVEGNFDDKKVTLSCDEETNKKASFVKTAIESTLAYLATNGKTKGVKVKTISDPAFGFGDTKSGLGSSAAVTTAVVAAVLSLHGVNISNEESRHLIHKIAQYSHSTSQGKIGSGFDIAASVFGGHEYVRYSPDVVKTDDVNKALANKWDYTATQLAVPAEFETVVANIEGESASTSAMVKKINEWKASDPAGYKELMAKINEADVNSVKYLRLVNEERDIKAKGKLLEEFKHWFNQARLLTKELGTKSGAPIETEELTKLIDASLQNGAFVCRLPGAGGGDSIAAWCLGSVQTTKLKTFWQNNPFKKVTVIKLSISNEGVRVEKNIPTF